MSKKLNIFNKLLMDYIIVFISLVFEKLGRLRIDDEMTFYSTVVYRIQYPWSGTVYSIQYPVRYSVQYPVSSAVQCIVYTVQSQTPLSHILK